MSSAKTLPGEERSRTITAPRTVVDIFIALSFVR
jgi:hypothetical protein